MILVGEGTACLSPWQAEAVLFKLFTVFILAAMPDQISQLPWTPVSILFGSYLGLHPTYSTQLSEQRLWVIWAPCTEQGGAQECRATSSNAHGLARVHIYKYLRSFTAELVVRVLPGAAHFSLLSLYYQTVCICL